ncbi:OVARIAN TUMOR DOMAIN-containing deubiquitinating enzyme 10-like isoform X3 [Cornus florida]|uniref:OVARIAN TUMOR DOMAIN-containing deubiquitinating enzyme 10-like isoform X3 n=1 Tax=Cornus florida TaxID=4283 RepID=UPI00289FB8E2|nr:OVARIAN TUMOR DOMAIN-containing deubiquitinating enzyme 10-like isoform X3 [Cornus florida]
MHEPDSDIVRWGLNFLDVDQLFNPAYYGDSNHYDVNICREQYIGDGNYDTECSNVENDEVIAHTLQDELSQLSIAEGDESSHAMEEHLQASTVSRDYWPSPSTRNFYSGLEDGQGEFDDVGPSSSCSSPGDKSYDGEEYLYSLEIADESSLDGEVGKRLNQVVPVPHVPRINGDIPSFHEATSDHQRLTDRLQLYDLIERKVQGDGNCQYGVKISVITSFKDTCYIEILPKVQKSERACRPPVIFLSFWAEVHYNSIYPQGDLLPSDFKRKKKWWNFRNKH